MKFETTTIRELHEQLQKGEVTVRDLMDRAHQAITERDETINAFIEIFSLDSEERTDHILSGIPAAVKDNIIFAGRKASAGSKMLENYRATYNSKIAEIFEKIKIPVIGRTNMDEFAMGSSTETSYYGPTRNPLDEHRVPGGSSGGSAAAVAAGMAVYALGSDTGGSIRQPAAYCGLVGLKPTYGSVSRRGLIAMASSLDVIGPMTRCVDDAEIVFNALSEYDEFDSTSVSLEGRAEYQVRNSNNKVIGIPRAFVNTEGISKEVLDNFNESLKKMESLGYRIVDIDLPHLHHSLAVYYIIQPAEASSNLARYDGIRYGFSTENPQDLHDSYTRSRTEGLGREVKRRIMLGTHVLSSGYHDEYYYKAQALRSIITQEIQEAFNDIDIIATPTAPSVAFKFGEKKDPISMYLEDIFTVPYNLSGNPALSIPSGKNSEGMPFGMHFVTPLFCEKKLFEVAKDFESTVIQ